MAAMDSTPAGPCYTAAMRVVSLVPAATEIVAALDMTDALVGVSHECDWPDAVRAKPRITRCDIHGNTLPSAETDRWVRERLRDGASLYTLDEATLRALEPDVILTQRLCDVCAVGYGSVLAFAATLPGPPAVVNLEPQRLGDVFQDVLNVGEALGVGARAAEVVTALQQRVNELRRRTRTLPPRRCVLLEWLDPPYRSGHWGPDLVTVAGGFDPLGVAGANAAAVAWDAVHAAAPEVVVIACCGYDVARTRQDLPLVMALDGWHDLPAVRHGAIWIADGSAYFSRPGPRLVDSAELLAQCLHPDTFGEPDPTRAVRVQQRDRASLLRLIEERRG
jgi:iron complex transport system substrate-binding protein